MTRRALFASLLVACVAHGQAAVPPFVGVLELRWGDPVPGAPTADRFEVNLVGADGTRLALDAASALQGAGNLHALAGGEVAVDAHPAPWPGGRLLVDAMVPSSSRSPDATAAPRIGGSQPWVTLACKFADVAVEPQTLGYFETMLSNEPGRLDHYWREVSYGNIDIAGSVALGWFTLPHPRSHYVPEGGSADLDALFGDCAAVADSLVHFPDFVGVNLFFNDDLDGYAWGGGMFTTLDGVTRLWYATWEPPWGYAHVAPMGHEMGHGFGLPHANNSDRDGDPYDNPWDVMSDSWSNATGNGGAPYGWLPKHLGIWSRDALGWIDSARKLVISTDGTSNGILLDRASLAGSTGLQMIVVTLPAPEPTTHYYVVEARKRVGDYEGALAGNAVIIHEVDTTRQEPAWSVDGSNPPADVANNEGSMFKVGESWTAPGDAFTVTVVAETSEGFVLDVQRGADSDVVFHDGFDG